MTKDEFAEMLMEVVKGGVEISMFYHKEGFWFNMNTGMKSHLFVTYDEEKEVCVYEGRYDVTGTIEDLDELLWAVRKCDYGRGFMNGAWVELLGENYDKS